jgi:hypothetical protein
MPQRPLGERTYSRSPRFFFTREQLSSGEAEPGWLWRKVLGLAIPGCRRPVFGPARPGPPPPSATGPPRLAERHTDCQEGRFEQQSSADRIYGSVSGSL